uniref:Uncharacterized protein n=1 Tax=Oryza punctata TaxID=4537 RepID=A0A0E0JR25_ORYPU
MASHAGEGDGGSDAWRVGRARDSDDSVKNPKILMGAKTDKGKVSEKPFKVLIKRKPKIPKVQRGRGFWFGYPLPKVVGLPVAEAKRRIKQCRPDVYIEF